MSDQATKPATAARMGRLEVDQRCEKMVGLGLLTAAEELTSELTEAVAHNRTAHQVLDRLLEKKVKLREERRVTTSLMLSGLPPGMTLPSCDFGFQPSLDEKQIETLLTCTFIREHTTSLLQGPPGVGKTHIAAGLAVAAIEHGFSVGFYRLEDLLHEMRQDEDVAPQRLRLRKYFNVAFLVVDDMGMEVLPKKSGEFLFEIIMRRHQTRSTIMTSNRPIEE